MLQHLSLTQNILINKSIFSPSVLPRALLFLRILSHCKSALQTWIQFSFRKAKARFLFFFCRPLQWQVGFVCFHPFTQQKGLRLSLVYKLHTFSCLPGIADGDSAFCRAGIRVEFSRRLRFTVTGDRRSLIGSPSKRQPWQVTLRASWGCCFSAMGAEHQGSASIYQHNFNQQQMLISVLYNKKYDVKINLLLVLLLLLLSPSSLFLVV